MHRVGQNTTTYYQVLADVGVSHWSPEGKPGPGDVSFSPHITTKRIGWPAGAGSRSDMGVDSPPANQGGCTRKEHGIDVQRGHSIPGPQIRSHRLCRRPRTGGDYRPHQTGTARIPRCGGRTMGALLHGRRAATPTGSAPASPGTRSAQASGHRPGERGSMSAGVTAESGRVVESKRRGQCPESLVRHVQDPRRRTIGTLNRPQTPAGPGALLQGG